MLKLEGSEKIRKVVKRRNWFVQSDAGWLDLSSDLVEAHVKASVMQHAVLILIQTELLYYSLTSCYPLSRLSPASALSSFPVTVSPSLEKQRNCTIPPFSRMVSLVFSLKRGYYLKSCGVSCLVGNTSRLSNPTNNYWAAKMCKFLCFMFA